MSTKARYSSKDVDRAAEVLGIEPRYCSQPWQHGMWTGTLTAKAAIAFGSLSATEFDKYYWLGRLGGIGEITGNEGDGTLDKSVT